MAEPLASDDPRQVGGYRLRARLGTGGMGQVYLAITPAGRRLALKMVRAEFGDDEHFRARFRQEVAAAQRVHGLFTAQVLDADPDAPQPWLAISYVPGPSLRQAVSECGPLPRDTVILLTAGIAEALQAIHAAGIVHRDLKPSNVILAADGPRVIDFGIARTAAAAAITAGGIRVGSPRFMAPEQAGCHGSTSAVDVFALGSLAGYASTGRPPFGSDHALAVLSRVLNEAPRLDGCPPDLCRLIERCLAKDPSQRPGPGDIIDTCRDLAGGVLSFERPWLPAAISAAAAAASPNVAPKEPGPPAASPATASPPAASPPAGRPGGAEVPGGAAAGTGRAAEPPEPAERRLDLGQCHGERHRRPVRGRAGEVGSRRRRGPAGHRGGRPRPGSFGWNHPGQLSRVRPGPRRARRPGATRPCWPGRKRHPSAGRSRPPPGHPPEEGGRGRGHRRADRRGRYHRYAPARNWAVRAAAQAATRGRAAIRSRLIPDPGPPHSGRP